MCTIVIFETRNYTFAMICNFKICLAYSVFSTNEGYQEMFDIQHNNFRD